MPADPKDKAIGIVGPSGSGKTELICRLLPWFEARGLRVAVLKHSHKNIDLKDAGKDTGRYRQAGARTAALAAPGLLQVIHVCPGDPALDQALAALPGEADLILVEGYKQSPLPKVAVVEEGAAVAAPDYPGVIALVSAAPPAAGSTLPVFHPLQVEDLGRFLLKHLERG